MSRLDQAFIRAFHESADAAGARTIEQTPVSTPIPTPPRNAMPRPQHVDYAGSIDVDNTMELPEFGPPYADPRSRFVQPRPQVCFPVAAPPTVVPDPAQRPLTRAESIAQQAAARTRQWTPHAAHTNERQPQFVPAPVLEYHQPEFQDARRDPPRYGTYVGKLAAADAPRRRTAAPVSCDVRSRKIRMAAADRQSLRSPASGL
ncbi:MAG: hypothetical protein QM811_28400 [Pirellulales bacterium]